MDEKKILNLLYYLESQGYGDKTVQEIIDEKETETPINYEELPGYNEFIQFCAEHGYQAEITYKRKDNSYSVKVPGIFYGRVEMFDNNPEMSKLRFRNAMRNFIKKIEEKERAEHHEEATP